jgi:hypothetical protein
VWKLTRPDNQHDKLVRDTLLDLQDHHLVRVELVREDQRQVWVLTRRGHGEAKKLLEPKGIRVSALREEKYDPDTGELLGASYDDHSAAVTSTAAELHRAGIGHRLGFATEIPHRLADGYVQRADLVVRAPAAGVPVMLLEIGRRTEDAHDLVAKLRRYWEWGWLLAPDADKYTVNLVRSQPGAIKDVGHEKRLWPRVTRGPAGRAWCHWRLCSPTPPGRKSTTPCRSSRKPAAATGRRAGTRPTTARRSRRRTTARPCRSSSPPWNN